MLKRNWRNNKLFRHSFFIGEITIGGALCPTTFAYAYALSEESKNCIRKFSARFLAFSNEISTVQKIVQSSSRGRGNFRGLEASRPRPRTRGFEAKDFKMCPRRPRSQGRPRGLHLWRLCIKLCAIRISDTGCGILVMLTHLTSGCLQHCQNAKQQNMRCIASSLPFFLV